MSTRVDKGGPKFRPVFRSRSRPSTTPVPQDVHRATVESGMSMPPPTVIPERVPSVAPLIIPAVSSDNAQLVQSSTPNMATSTAQTTLETPTSSAIPTTIQRPTHSPPAVNRPISTRTVGTDPEASDASPVISIGNSTMNFGTPSRSVPIVLSRNPSMPPPASIATPIPAPQMTPLLPMRESKRRHGPAAGTEISDEGSSEIAPPVDFRGGVARKRPKLSIVQAEEGRVKKPKRAARKTATSATHSSTDVIGEGGTNGAEAPKKRTATRKNNVDRDVGRNVAELAPRSKRAYNKRGKAQENEEDSQRSTPESGSRQESVGPVKRKRRNRQETEPLETESSPVLLDPTQVTMGAICDDPRTGRVSSRWETSQVLHADARKRAREERARAIAEASAEEHEAGRTGNRKGPPRPALPTAGDEAGKKSNTENAVEDPDEFTYEESLKASHYAPQVRIGANGQVVLDVESLQVDRTAEIEHIDETYNFVEETDQSRFTNSNSWSSRRSVRWSKEETAMFYDALRQFGQNFDLIARVLPGKTYRMCKNKFKAEDKGNPQLIDDALKNGVAVDIDTLSRMTGKDFSGPTPIIGAETVRDASGSQMDGGASRDDAALSVDAPRELHTSRTQETQMVDGGDKSSEAETIPRQVVSTPPTQTFTSGGSPSPPPAETVLDSILMSTRTRLPGPVPIIAPT